MTADARGILYGFHAVLSRLRQHSHSIHEIYVAADRADARSKDLLQVASQYGVRIVTVDAQRLDGLTGHRRHQGVAATVTAVTARHDLDSLLDSLKEPALLLVLDGVQDPHNLGACLRVADAFGAHAVIAPKDRAVGLTPVVAKVASGAAETVPYIAVTNLARALRELKERGIVVMGADGSAAASLFRTELHGALAWVLGAEGSGMRRLTREHCDVLVRIPISGTVGSLNVSVASAVCLAETVRQRSVASVQGEAVGVAATGASKIIS